MPLVYLRRPRRLSPPIEAEVAIRKVSPEPGECCLVLVSRVWVGAAKELSGAWCGVCASGSARTDLVQHTHLIQALRCLDRTLWILDPSAKSLHRQRENACLLCLLCLSGRGSRVASPGSGACKLLAGGACSWPRRTPLRHPGPVTDLLRESKPEKVHGEHFVAGVCQRGDVVAPVVRRSPVAVHQHDDGLPL